MLNNVPNAINRMARNVVINHPNTYNCVAVRKRVTRDGPVVSGMSTMGGMGVMSDDDEESIEWDPLGNGYALKSEIFSPSVMMDRQDANNSFADEFRFLIEPEIIDPLIAEYWIPKKHDVIYLVVGDTRLAFEIVGVETTSDIPPYTQRYVCNRRDDLHFTF